MKTQYKVSLFLLSTLINRSVSCSAPGLGSSTAQLNEADRSLHILNESIGDYERLTDEYAACNKQLAACQAKLKEEEQQKNKALEELKAAQQENAALDKELKECNADFDRLDSIVKRYQTKYKDLGDAIKKAGEPKWPQQRQKQSF